MTLSSKPVDTPPRSGVGCGLVSVILWLLGVDGLAVTLTRGLARGSDHCSDRGPRVPVGAGSNDRVTQCSFGLRAGQECFANYSQGGGVAEVVGLGMFESCCEFVSVVEEFCAVLGMGIT